MQFDYRGTLVNPSTPTKVLRKLTKIVTVDSTDRDPTLFVKVNGGANAADAGDYVVYLPRVYEKVTKITLKSAIIQAPVVLSTAATTIGFQPTDTYILLGLEGLNRKDETAPGADRAGYVDSWFAKLPNDTGAPRAGATVTTVANTAGVITYTTAVAHGLSVGQTVCITGCSAATANLAYVQIATVPTTTTFTVVNPATPTGSTMSGVVFIPGTLYYNDASYDEQLVEYSPPISRLQRIRVTLRRHTPIGSIGTTTPLGAPITFGAAQNSFTFEIEYLDNGFDDFSSMSTSLRPSDVNYVR